jgi:hypothetical protein
MAATDIEYGGLDPVLYTPDFSFLKYVLDKKTANYEKGLQAASSSFNSLKKELSDPTNVQKRDQYLKDIQGQLQTIGGSDFSLQQNVNYANSIFEPLATDKAILFDAYHTARIKNQLAIEDSWMKSEDPEVRKRYNPEIAEWTARDLDSLKKGNGDIKNYNVKNRSAVAYIDPQDILDKEVKTKGFKYKVGDPTKDGAYIITEEGGVGGTKNYEQFANEVLSNNEAYKRQNEILGENRIEKLIQHYKTDPKLAPNWANKKNDEILTDYALESFNTHKIQEKESLDLKAKNLQKDNADILAALNGPDSQKYIQGATDVKNNILDSENAKLYLSLKQKADSYNGLSLRLNEFQQDYDKTYNDASKTNYLESFVKNPIGFFANQQFSRDITKFSNIQASSYTREIKENKAFIDALTAKNNALSTLNKIEDTKIDNARADIKLALDERKEDFKESLKGNTVVRNADGTTTVVPGKENEIKFGDISATQLVTSRALNDMKNNVLNAQSSALNNVTSNYGMFSLLNPMGVNKTDVGLLRQMFTRYFTSTPDNPFVPKPEENKALSSAYTSLWSFAKTNPKNTFLEEERANFKTKKLTIDQFPDMLDKAMTGYTSANQADMDAKIAMTKYKSDIELIKIHNSVLEKGKQVVINELKGNTDFEGMFKYNVDKKTGIKIPTDLIDSDYIYNNLKVANNIDAIEKVGQIFHSNTSIKFSDEDLKNLANGYINGTIDFENYSRGNSDSGPINYTKFTYQGQEYKTQGISFSNSNHIVPYDSKDFQNKLQKINERIPIGRFEQSTGTVGASPFFTLGGQTKQDVIEDLGKVTLTNSNVLEYKDGTFTATQLDSKEQNDARNALYKKENVTNVTLFTSSPLNSGGQAVSVTFNTETGKDIPSWSGKTLYFPISPTKSSPKVFQIFNNINDGITEFEASRQKGTPYPINTFKAEGVYAEVTPSQPGSTNGTIQLWFKPYNAITKKYADQFVQYNENGKDNEFDLGINTYKEIENNIYKNFIFPYVNGTLTYNKQQQANATASGNTPVTANSIYQSLIK